MTQAVKVKLSNPNILKWAREEIRLTVPEVAKRFNKKNTIIEAWEEGEEDYSRLIGIKPSKSYDDQITVVHNSCMVMNTIIKAGIFFSRLEWRLGVSKFVDDFMRYMAEGSNDYLVTFREVKRMVEMNLDLCQIKK